MKTADSKKLPKTAVVDASFVLAFLFPDERSDHVDHIFDAYQKGEMKLTSTELLPYEVCNGIRSAVLRKRTNASEAGKLAKHFFGLHLALKETVFEDALEFSLKNKISFYDASYVLLSRQLDIPFLTLDIKLQHLVTVHV